MPRHALLAALVATLLAGTAAAQSFDCLTNNTGNCAGAADGLSWRYDGNSLTISNAGPVGSFISGVYFAWANDDAMAVTSVSASGTVKLIAGGKPGHLPGASDDFDADVYWTARSPAAKNGVNGGEAVTFTLSGVSPDDFRTGAIRVGVHVQGFSVGSSTASESMVLAVPEPESYAMLLAGLGLMGTIVARRRPSTPHGTRSA